VREQTGIHAGAGGFDIQVGNRTSLTGAVIASDATDPAKNKLDTQTLDFADIRNHSEYDAKSLSISVSAGSGGGSVSGGMSHQSDSVTGATKSAIAAGGITVRSDHDVSGNRIQDSLAGLSRDTANANGSVENIFNPQQLAEQQEMAQVAGEVGFRTVGAIGEHFVDKKVENEAIAQQLEKEGRNDEAAALREKNRQIDAVWGEGGVAKIALHTAVGAAQASLGGGDVLAGALGAGVAEAARKVDVSKALLDGQDRDNNGNKTGLAKAIDQLASTAVGLGAGALAGDAMTGGAAAWDAEKFNRQLHKDEKEELKRRAAVLDAEGNPMRDANGEILVDADRYNKLLLAAYSIVHYGNEMGGDVAYRQTAQAMQLEGMFTDEFRSWLAHEIKQGGNLESALKKNSGLKVYTDEYLELTQSRSDTFLRYEIGRAHV
jgi:filamentous hemagglutinin